MDTGIYKNILAYQAGDSSAAWALVQKFEPMLKHYAFALYREDAFEDLQCYFLSLMKNLSLERLESLEDGAIIKYIMSSIRHEYIAPSKAKAKQNAFTYIDELNPFASEEFNKRSSQQDDYGHLLLQDMKELLTDNEYRILVALYFEQWSVSEIAQRMHKSRQAVNQAKNHALDKLRHAWNS